ncbi:MAG: hypothetical protein AB1798_01650, partial [Spirochaetota bacterium]
MLFLDTKRKQEEESHLQGFILEVESRVKARPDTRYGFLKSFLDDAFPGWEHYFKIAHQSGVYRVVKQNHAIEAAVRRFGTLILLSNSRIDGEGALAFYRKKDGVEKFFDSMKNGLDRKRLRIHGRKVLEGLLFIDF